ncbi:MULTISPECIES: ANTAR domain-containing response regulator [Aurantimonas]|uniref:ANTAR domain-containing response regulator n=1 Tax=Aurantimonas TaxID=182269 RepID=UPI0016520127|nr:ANTAR domain-containing protein [Aurantimonas coralicida]MBC6716275.1 transcriptional antiterminator [Aurantimonas sp. DM33-3]MCW7542634.1 ANTAR domain-containing protein [Aurantimonas litoralis]MCD1641695.1 ANTAR domain-containing protein [Aurantimonas coralicida]MDE0923716.1 ANTAR domain-containing protein [Aurantimonas coralicida]MDX1729587.1 ANTAR domain-containing protein [Aurantimonas coralicida]
MTRRSRIPNLGGARAFVLHPPHATTAALVRQLAAIGLDPVECWPDLPADALAADFIFFDADLGYDAQFPWTPGEAPMPMIALIGSEAPGRIEWALSHGAHSHLVKPVANSGIYSALLIARQGFEARRSLADEVRGLKGRVAERQTIVRAAVALSAGGVGEERAYAQLRALAMSWQTTMEEAARRVLALEEGGRDERRTRL